MPGARDWKSTSLPVLLADLAGEGGFTTPLPGTLRPRISVPRKKPGETGKSGHRLGASPAAPPLTPARG